MYNSRGSAARGHALHGPKARKSRFDARISAQSDQEFAWSSSPPPPLRTMCSLTHTDLRPFVSRSQDSRLLRTKHSFSTAQNRPFLPTKLQARAQVTLDAFTCRLRAHHRPHLLQLPCTFLCFSSMSPQLSFLALFGRAL